MGGVQIPFCVFPLVNHAPRSAFVALQNSYSLPAIQKWLGPRFFSALSPLPRYDHRFADALGKWMLAVAVNARHAAKPRLVLYGAHS